MRPKRLKKKIRQLEIRLQKDRRKLAKLEKKLKAVLAEQAKKRQRKASTHTIERLMVKAATLTAQPEAEGKSETATSSVVPKGVSQPKQRRRLNISPERRAQLSAQMKA